MKRLLVVDDEERIRKTYQAFFTAKGYQVEGVARAAEARVLLERQQIDLVLLDLLMPQEDGVDLFDYIKNRAPATKIIITSVCAVSEQQFAIFDADDYFDKSEGLASLWRKINAIISCAIK